MSMFNELFQERPAEESNPRRINLDEQKMTLKLEAKSVYGRYLYYPVCEKSEKLTKILQGNKKAFTEDQMKILHDVGFRILLSIPNIKGEIVYNPND